MGLVDKLGAIEYCHDGWDDTEGLLDAMEDGMSDKLGDSDSIKVGTPVKAGL